MWKKITLINIAFLLLFSANAFSQNIITMARKVGIPLALAVTDTNVAVSEALTLDLDNYVSGDTAGVDYEFINEGDTSATYKTGLWKLPVLRNSGDHQRYWSVNGNKISLFQTTYTRGLSLKPNSELVLDVSDTTYGSFSALIGCDGESGDSDGIAVNIYVDGGLEDAGPTKHAWDRPYEVSFSLNNADSIKIETSNVGSKNHASLANCYVLIGTGGTISQYSEATKSGHDFQTTPGFNHPLDPDTIIFRAFTTTEADTDTFVVNVTNPYDSLNIDIAGGSETVYDYPIKFVVNHQTGMRNDFRDMEFFSYNVDTLKYWIENYVSGDSATVWVNCDTIDAAGDSIQLRYNWNNQYVNDYNNNLFVFNFLEDGRGIPTYWMPSWVDTTGMHRGESPHKEVNDRGCIIDSAGVLYFFWSGTDNYDVGNDSGSTIFLYTSQDSGETWDLEHGGDSLVVSQWGEDVQVYENPYDNAYPKWLMIGEHESVDPYDSTEMWGADSLMQVPWDHIPEGGVTTDYANGECAERGYAYTGTCSPCVYSHKDTLWLLYEAITRGDATGSGDCDPAWGATIATAYSTDGVNFTKSDTANDPIMKNSYETRQLDYYTGFNPDPPLRELAGIERIYEIDGYYHLLGHQELIGGIYKTNHWFTKDMDALLHTRYDKSSSGYGEVTLDPDTNVIKLNIGMFGFASWVPWLDDRGTFHYWMWGHKPDPNGYFKSRPFSYTYYDYVDTTGTAPAGSYEDEMWGELPADSLWYTPEGLFVQWTDKEEDIIGTTNVRPVGESYIIEVGGMSLGPAAEAVDGAFVTFWNSDSNRVLEWGESSDQWKIRNDSTGTSVKFPNHANGILDSTFYLRVKCNNDTAGVWAKRNIYDDWQYEGSAGTVRHNSAITRIAIGNYWTGTTNSKGIIKSMKLYEFVATEPSATVE